MSERRTIAGRVLPPPAGYCAITLLPMWTLPRPQMVVTSGIVPVGREGVAAWNSVVDEADLAAEDAPGPAGAPLQAACAFTRKLLQRNDGLPVYCFHVPERDVAWVGAWPERVLTYDGEGFAIRTPTQRMRLPDGGDPFAVLRRELDPSRPCFFMISLDLRRTARDPALPLLLFIQPSVELKFSRRQGRAESMIDAASPALEGQARTLLAEPQHHCARTGRHGSNEQAISPWCTEGDEPFLRRLEEAVRVLGTTPGKMIISRSYRKETRPGLDPFRLFEIYAASEPHAAASHYLALDPSTFSLGCSPENVFELERGRLAFDVIAATRGRSDDPERDQRWLSELQQDDKERTEHLMAFDRYRQRLETLCLAGSTTIEKSMDVRTLKRVRHLYSRVSGMLRPDLDFIDLLEESFPPLSSYPDELIPLADPELEPMRYYGGIVGRAGSGLNEGSSFLNLRSALMQGGAIHTQGGVGVIRESKPRQELLEVTNKLRSLMEAVSEWENE